MSTKIKVEALGELDAERKYEFKEKVKGTLRSILALQAKIDAIPGNTPGKISPVKMESRGKIAVLRNKLRAMKFVPIEDGILD